MPYKDTQDRLEAVRRFRKTHLKQYADKQAKYYDNNPDMYLLITARTRAKKHSIPFNLKREDIIVPTHCPVFGTPLERGTRGFHESSPTLDRIRPELGYVRGNVVVVSFRANRMKQNATTEELRKLAAFYENLEREGTKQGALSLPESGESYDEDVSL